MLRLKNVIIFFHTCGMTAGPVCRLLRLHANSAICGSHAQSAISCAALLATIRPSTRALAGPILSARGTMSITKWSLYFCIKALYVITRNLRTLLG